MSVMRLEPIGAGGQPKGAWPLGTSIWYRAPDAEASSNSPEFYTKETVGPIFELLVGFQNPISKNTPCSPILYTGVYAGHESISVFRHAGAKDSGDLFHLGEHLGTATLVAGGKPV